MLRLNFYSRCFRKFSNHLSVIRYNGTVHEKSLATKLKEHFESNMECKEFPLLKDFDTYAKSLPVRNQNYTNSFLKLFELPHWTNSADMNVMVDNLLDNRHKRRYVKYLAAPSTTGKTSSILPAFLQSTKRDNGFTHYFYIAFDNNKKRNFRLAPFLPNSDVDIALDQGSEFIFDCVKSLLEEPEKETKRKILRNENPKDRAEDLELYLSKLSCGKSGKKPKILFHLDEHRKMCQRTDQFENPLKEGAAFSKGAMQCLSNVTNVTVIATYTDKPPIEPIGSSTVCRYPVTLPPLDINKAMKNIPELNVSFKVNELSSENKRKYLTLKFKLAWKLIQFELTNLHSKDRPEDIKKFLSEFQDANSTGTPTEIIKKSLDLCNIKPPNRKICDYAMKLLLGIDEKDIDKVFDRQAPGDLLVIDLIWTAHFMSLLSYIDPNNSLYTQGRQLFIELLGSSDYISATPLEVAYSWFLSCESASSGTLTFNFKTFTFKCEELCPGRLFGSELNEYDSTFAGIRNNTLYYTDEKENNKATHPLCDLFFITNEPEEKQSLVMIDITGGSDKVTKKKQIKISNWIEENQVNIVDFNVYGVVLAPNSNKIKSYSLKSVEVVCGEDARSLLGGLKQIYRWSILDEDENENI